MEDQDPMGEEFLPPKKQPNTMRSWWIKTILMLVLIGVSIAVLFTITRYITDTEVKQVRLSTLIKGIDYPLFFLFLGAILLYILVESFKYSYMLKVYTGKFRFGTSVKTMILGKYYDGITPLSTGGQPFQILYLHKKDIPHGVATAIPIIRYIVSIFILTTLSVILLALSPRYVPQDTATRTTLILSWISLVINFMVPIAVVLFSIFPKASKKVIAGVVSLLHKMHIVKHKYRVEMKFVREMTEYSQAIRQFLREFLKYVPLVFLSIFESFLFVTIPFFVVIAIANVPPTVELAMQIACLVIITRYVALLVPTPGNTGAVEATGSIIFITVAGIEPVVGWVILIWRFVTYYVYILTGIGLNIFEIIRGAVRNRRKTE